MQFIANTPALRLWCNKRAVTHRAADDGELLECWLLTVKSVPAQTWMFQAFFPVYAAVYDKLPVSAFCVRDRWPEDALPLSMLVWWDCMARDIQVFTIDFLRNFSVRARLRDKQIRTGRYLFSIEHCHADPDRPDTGFSECWPEHKSAHLVALDSGQIAICPNNTLLWHDDSLTAYPEPCEFKCYPHQDFPAVENPVAGLKLGDSDDYYYGGLRGTEED